MMPVSSIDKSAILLGVVSSRSGSHHSSWEALGDECLVLSCGTGFHAQASARFTAETALWGYKLIRQRPFYWDGKDKLLRRMFRSTNIALWQKQREDQYTEGMNASLAVVLSGPKNYWVGVAGDMNVFLYRNAMLVSLVAGTKRSAVLGKDRYGLIPETCGDLFLPHDVIVTFPGEVQEHTLSVIQSRLNAVTETKEDLAFIGKELVSDLGIEAVGLVQRLR